MVLILLTTPKLVEPIVISLENDPESVMRGISIFTKITAACFGLIAIFVFTKLNTTMQYMSSIKSRYGLDTQHDDCEQK
jgi:hypothetical protein